MNNKTIGFALCGSFCTLNKVIPQIEGLINTGYKVIPILSFNVSSLDTRFGSASDLISKINDITKEKAMVSITDVEPIGPKSLLDLLIIAPCTGNTLAKIANGISDTPVTLAAKSHMRNSRPVLIAVSTNDALSVNAKNIGTLMAMKNIYFVPLAQDEAVYKPCSAVADMDLIIPAANAALDGTQIQPLLYSF